MFSVHYWDPPWDFNDKKTGGNFTSGAKQQYETMALSAIQQLPVQAVTSHQAVLFLWVPTALKFTHGYTTGVAWGFEYVTTVYWDKTPDKRLGMGHWFRNQVEELLVFKRGQVRPFHCQLPNIIHAPRERHSRKPEAFRRLIHEATGEPSKYRNVEGFARVKASGWTSWGNEVTGVDVRQSIREQMTGTGELRAGGLVAVADGEEATAADEPQAP